MSDELRRIGHIDTHQNNQLPLANLLTQPYADPHQALRELLELLGGGDMLIVYRYDRLVRSDVDTASLQRQLEAMGIQLVTEETVGESHDK
jgi:DNA invertase Pin-like site-specific DNA recombinase